MKNALRLHNLITMIIFLLSFFSQNIKLNNSYNYILLEKNFCMDLVNISIKNEHFGIVTNHMRLDS